MLRQGEFATEMEIQAVATFCKSHFTYTPSVHHIPHGHGIDMFLQYYQTMHIPL